MSVPKELLESMLSAYMDDVLSPDERTRVEQMLAGDSSMRAQLEEMRTNRAALRQIHGMDSEYKLPDHFASSVIEATVERARREGLADEHPVMRLAEQPITHPSRSRSYAKVATAVAALAASIAIAVVAVRGTADPETVAQRPPSIPSQPNGDLSNTLLDPASLATSVDVAADRDMEASSESADPTALASSSDSTQPLQTDRSMESGPAIPDGNAIASASVAASQSEATRQSEAIRQSTPLAARAKSVVPVSAILVLEVRLTMSGVDSDAVSQAMELGGIEAVSRKAIDEDVVRFAKQSTQLPADELPSASVLYLQAPMKKLDRFINHLVADDKGVDSVRMSLATETPLVRLVNSIRAVDPTTIQSESSSWQLDAGQRGNRTLASHLSNRAFAGLDRNTARMGVVSSVGSASTSPSDDVPASILIVVR
ncbi:hypothetical protein Q31b_19880 [Novipirellula aureliae]|uniref:Zinc-finger domain-containing protein n=1 Tax=Novipirellula aureliae TaxID=2527966 RepID=A0A5C6E372_9BACT|nr:hypothetical protein [Novipirellula aureliae]TWU42954.1 hypothetical protein Q31b_19880 [Novipirellula aureliae]